MEGDPRMIYLSHLSKAQLGEIRYLMDQSMRGNHVLFDQEKIREVFERPHPPISPEDAYSVEHHIERILQQPSLEQKKAYLDSLDEHTYTRVVQTYFKIIDQRLARKITKNEGARH
jgi:hypothetical protein